MTPAIWIERHPRWLAGESSELDEVIDDGQLTIAQGTAATQNKRK